LPFTAKCSADNPTGTRCNARPKMLDSQIGEALGQLFRAKYFPPEARARMMELVGNLKAVFQDRLQKLDWMTEATRSKALAKFAQSPTKIGTPDKFRITRNWRSAREIISAMSSARRFLSPSASLSGR